MTAGVASGATAPSPSVPEAQRNELIEVEVERPRKANDPESPGP